MPKQESIPVNEFAEVLEKSRNTIKKINAEEKNKISADEKNLNKI